MIISVFLELSEVIEYLHKYDILLKWPQGKDGLKKGVGKKV